MQLKMVARARAVKNNYSKVKWLVVNLVNTLLS